jgi:nucleotide-binding universal stress UspA family protein
VNTTKTARPDRVVVGIDGSDESKLALRWAARLAHDFGTTIHAVTAWEYPATYGWSAGPSDWNPAQDADKLLIETIDEVFGSERPAGLELTVAEGYPAQVLLTAAATALMVVVGSRGHGGFVGLLLGSVSTNLTEHAHCPVLVMHAGIAPPAS